MKPVWSSYFSVLLFIFCMSFLLKTSISQTGWVNQSSGVDLPLKKIYFIDENTGWAASSGGYIFSIGGHFIRTTNGGINWTTITHGFIAYNSFCFLNSQTGWLVGNSWTDYGGFERSYIFRATNGGLNWSNIYMDSVLTGYNDISMIDENNWFVSGGEDTALILKTTNAGINWFIYRYPGIRSISKFSFINSSTGWVAGYDGFILKTTNFGTSLAQIAGFTGYILRSICFTDSSYGWVCGDNGLILKSTDGGYNWVNQNSGINSSLNFITLINKDTGWTCGDNGKILYTNDGGYHWMAQVSNTSYSLNTIYFLNDKTGWAGGGISNPLYIGIILKTTTGGLIPVEHIGKNVPQVYFLAQNSPNPFNPSTKITFALPKKSFVKFTIYDIQGREIALLISEELGIGEYSINWDASNYPSGVYFYRMEAGNYYETRKMVLLK